MGYKVITENVNNILRQLSKDYLIYAPKVFEGDGRFSELIKKKECYDGLQGYNGKCK